MSFYLFVGYTSLGIISFYSFLASVLPINDKISEFSKHIKYQCNIHLPIKFCWIFDPIFPKKSLFVSIISEIIQLVFIFFDTTTVFDLMRQFVPKIYYMMSTKKKKRQKNLISYQIYFFLNSVFNQKMIGIRLRIGLIWFCFLV